MFKLFLRKKMFAGDGEETPPTREEKNGNNRRGSTRYAVDHKHLTLMNEQDILLVREISAKGFSVELSERGYERLNIGDIYDARARYLGEIYDMEARVTWKQDQHYVGFEVVNAARETLQFINRLLRPIEIATSLQPVEASFLNQPATGKSWYHGEGESDLYTWHDPETNQLTAWQLSVGDSYVEWNSSNGLVSGKVVALQGHEGLLGANLPGLTQVQDGKLDLSKKQFTTDVVMALQISVRDEILPTLTAK